MRNAACRVEVLPRESRRRSRLASAASCHSSLGCACPVPAGGIRPARGGYLTTKLTSRPGTTTVLISCWPSSKPLIRSSRLRQCLQFLATGFGGDLDLARTLPQIWTGTSIVASTVRAGSNDGQASNASEHVAS